MELGFVEDLEPNTENGCTNFPNPFQQFLNRSIFSKIASIYTKESKGSIYTKESKGLKILSLCTWSDLIILSCMGLSKLTPIVSHFFTDNNSLSGSIPTELAGLNGLVDLNLGKYLINEDEQREIECNCTQSITYSLCILRKN